jgi:hypothetical protein
LKKNPPQCHFVHHMTCYYTYYQKKAKLSLCLISQVLCHEYIWGSGGIAPPFLTSALDEGEWSASRPWRSTPGERAPCTHWTGGWVCPKVGLDVLNKTKILHCRESNPGRPARCYPNSYTYYLLFFLICPSSGIPNGARCFGI